MADQKISQLTDGGNSQATDEYVIARSGANYRIDGASIAAAATSVGTLTSLAVSGDLTVDTSTLKVDSTNNRVGIGTASPGFRTTIEHNFPSTFSNAAGDYALMVRDDAPENWLGIAGQTTGDKWVGLITNGSPAPALVLGTGGAERVRIDASGNVGIGVTPSAWGLGKALEINNTGNAIWGVQTADLRLFANTRYDGTNYRYTNTGSSAARFDVNNGTLGGFSFHTAPSGTAGNVISFTQAMTLDASGNLGVGETSPSAKLHVVLDNAFVDASINLQQKANGTASVFRLIANNDAGAIYNAISSSTNGGTEHWRITGNGNASTFAINTGGTERARITSGGYFKASNNGTYNNAAGEYHEIRNSTNNGVLYVHNTNASFTDGAFVVRTTKVAGTDFNFIVAQANFANQFVVRGDGNVTNTNGSYGTISDERLKQDIVDASSQWDDIKAVRFRKYRMKTDVEANPDAPFMLGVVAQELELVSPGLVDEHPNEDGTTTKTVKSSILLMKAAVALQEAMARIESLEARLAALES
jgi:hypothetical protein